MRDSRTFQVEGKTLRIPTTRTTPTRANAEEALRILAPGERVLFVVDDITPSLRRAATMDDRIVVISPAVALWEGRTMGLDDEEEPRPSRTSGRRPYARFAVARALLAVDDHATQQQLVESAGISQGRVSEALASPLFKGVVERTWGKIQVADRRELFDRAVTEYPGPGGVATYWWHGKGVLEQADAVATVDETALVSGDAAADRIRAWRTPERAVVYTRGQPNLRNLGFALADSSDYTLMLVHAEDRTIWSTAHAWKVPRTADPMIASFDVLRTGTLGDQGEAVDRIRDYVVGRTQ
ncbi:hypothetical protein ACFC14_02250 [Microbacterium sp. NPDC055988]|uniref:hypothetical protein n=1 Tax=Microbacterium sp. NPDC055988 TaxID=3345671 RepID=UPI0035E25007